MIYYLTRLMMKYLYYIKKDNKTYIKLSEFNKAYKEEYGKPRFFIRLRLIILTPILYVYALYYHKKYRYRYRKSYWRYNRFFKSWWSEWWEKGYSDMEQYTVQGEKERG